MKCKYWFLRDAGVFQEKSANFHFFSPSVYKVCDAMTFSGKVVTERTSAGRNLLIATTIAEIENVAPRRIGFETNQTNTHLLRNSAYQVCVPWKQKE